MDSCKHNPPNDATLQNISTKLLEVPLFVMWKFTVDASDFAGCGSNNHLKCKTLSPLKSAIPSLKLLDVLNKVWKPPAELLVPPVPGSPAVPKSFAFTATLRVASNVSPDESDLPHNNAPLEPVIGS